MGDWWRGSVTYQIYPRSFQELERRRDRRPAGDHRAAALRRRPRGRRGLAVADLHLADAGHGLRRLRLHRHRPDLRLARRFRRHGRAGARARAQGHHRPGAVAFLRPAPLLHGKPVEPRQPEGRLVRLGRSQARRHAAEQLALGLRRPRLGLGRAAATVLPAQFSGRAARLQLPQPRGPEVAALDHALLAGARRRRLPPRHGELLLPRRAAARRPGRLPQEDASRRPTPTAMQYHIFSKNQPENLAFLEEMRTAPRRVRGARHGRRDGREPPRHPDDGRVHHRQAAA